MRPLLYGNKHLGFFEDLTAKLHAASVLIIKDDPPLLCDAGEAHRVCEGDKFAPCFADDGQSEDASQDKVSVSN